MNGTQRPYQGPQPTAQFLFEIYAPSFVLKLWVPCLYSSSLKCLDCQRL
jgi:hypothetical protein